MSSPFPSFFKVVRYPSAPHLSLPIAFVRKYLEKIPNNLELKTASGDNSWRLKMKRMGEDYCFSDGWEKFAKDAQLRIMDILIFWLIDPFTFRVSLYGPHGCEKDLISSNTSDCDDVDEEEDEVMADENLSFQKVISDQRHKYTMSLPEKFVVAAGLENKSGIKMKDHKGKEWIMGLLAEKDDEGTKHSLSSGWPLFRQYYSLSDGDICLFKFVKEEGVLILAQVLKTKNETPNMEGMKRKRGRPPLNKHCGGEDVKVKNECEAEVVKRKRGRPPLNKHCGGGVKIEDGLEPVKRKRGRPPLKKADGGGGGGGGGVNVKMEDESATETEAEPMKRKRGRPPLKKADGGGGGGVNVKMEEDGWGAEVKSEGEREEVVKRKSGRRASIPVVYF